MNSSPRTILVRAPNWIGDQIIAYSFFYHLRTLFPQARITAVCVPWVEAIQFRNLVDDVCVLPRHGKSLLAEFRSLESAARTLRALGPWDLGISLPNSFSAAWLLFRAGVKTRRGYRKQGRALLLNDSVPMENPKNLHRAQIFFNLLPGDAVRLESVPGYRDDSARKSPPPEESILPPGFDPTSAWPGAQPLEPPVDPFWVLAPGSIAESRRWPIENFLAIARIIHRQTGWKGVLVGGPAEKQLAAQLVMDSGEILFDYTSRGTAASCWKIFRAAKFTVSNDSGLAHVASLCGLPGRSLVQVVWGAGVPERTRPLGPSRVQIMFNTVDCWPCEHNHCFQPAGHKLKCLQGIEPAAVWQQIERALGTSDK